MHNLLTITILPQLHYTTQQQLSFNPQHSFTVCVSLSMSSFHLLSSKHWTIPSLPPTHCLSKAQSWQFYERIPFLHQWVEDQSTVSLSQRSLETIWFICLQLTHGVHWVQTLQLIALIIWKCLIFSHLLKILNPTTFNNVVFLEKFIVSCQMIGGEFLNSLWESMFERRIKLNSIPFVQFSTDFGWTWLAWTDRLPTLPFCNEFQFRVNIFVLLMKSAFKTPTLTQIVHFITKNKNFALVETFFPFLWKFQGCSSWLDTGRITS